MSRNQIKTACVEMVGPDVQMDQRGDTYEPANPLPIQCPHCTFPDLDVVPQPYFLTKGVSTPSEISPAQMGNFLVRGRVRRILELVVPKACRFFPTAEKKTKKPTEWSLAVPAQILGVPGLKTKKPYCSRCHESKEGYVFADHASYLRKMRQFDSQGVDVFKTQNWKSMGIAEEVFESINRERKRIREPLLSWKEWNDTPGLEPPTHRERWTRDQLARDLLFSVRLEQLLKRAKVKGQLVRYASMKDVQPTPEDEAWIQDKLRILAENGLADAPKVTSAKAAGATPKWFKQFVKRNARKGTRPIDFSAVEQKQKLTLPQDYKDFISTLGSKSFEDVNGTEGFTATVLPPQKLDFRGCRRGKVPYLEGEQAQIDGVMFASTEHGDCFVFDVSAKSSDYPVFWYDHEQNTLEPFAPNFAECIRRFAEKN